MAIPNQPTQAFVSRATIAFGNILKWAPVIEDIENNSTTILSYKVLRTTRPNSLGLVEVKEVTTLDIGGFVDSIFFDADLEEGADHFYRVVAVNADGESELSEEASDIVL